MAEISELSVPQGITGVFREVGLQVDQQLVNHQTAYKQIKEGNILFKDTKLEKCNQLVTVDYLQQKILMQLRAHLRQQIEQKIAPIPDVPTVEHNQQIDQELSKTKPIEVVELLDTWIMGWRHDYAKKYSQPNLSPDRQQSEENHSLAIEAAQRLSRTFLESSLTSVQ